MNWLNTKKANLFFFLFFLAVVILSIFINESYRSFQITIELSEFSFWMSVPALIYSVIAIFLREEVSRSWRLFTFVYMAISVFIILITPNSSHGMDIFPLIKENVTILLAVLYSIISAFIIIYKAVKNNS